MADKILKAVEIDETEFLLICKRHIYYSYQTKIKLNSSIFNEWYVYKGRLVYFRESLKDFVYVPLRKTKVHKIESKDMAQYYKYIY
jgi:hypothetical protein